MRYTRFSKDLLPQQPKVWNIIRDRPIMPPILLPSFAVLLTIVFYFILVKSIISAQVKTQKPTVPNRAYYALEKP